MENKHIIEKNLKTINGQSILGEGNIEIVSEAIVDQNIDASTLTPEQLDYLRDKQIKYGMWGVAQSSINNLSVTPGVTKLPIFNRKHNGNLVANNDETFTLKAKRLYKIEVYISVTSNNSDYFRFSLYNDITNNFFGSGLQLISPPTLTTTNFVVDPAISEYIEVEVDTPISVRLFNRNGSVALTTIQNLSSSTRIHIAEISSFDVSLKNFTINGKSFDENNNIDLEGLSTLSHPKLNVEVLTERRHPVSGKPIYVKTIDFGYLPNTTFKNVPHTVIGYDYIGINLEYSYIYIPGISGFSYTGANIIWNNKVEDVGTYIDGSNISMATGKNRTNMKAYITVEYTKTIDTSESPVRLVGGGFKYVESSTEPDNPSLGDEWHNTTNDILYKRRKKNGVLGWYEI